MIATDGALKAITSNSFSTRRYANTIQNRSTERLVPSVPLRGSKLRVASPRVVEVSRTPTGKQATRSVPQESPKSDNFLPLKRLPLIPSFLSKVREDQALTDLDIP